MKKLSFFPLLFFFTICSVFAQNTKTVKEETPYRSQISVGLNFTTIGGLLGGGSFRYSQSVTARQYHIFSLDVINVKHPKEQKTQSITGETFVPGKQNFLVMMRPHYGREFVLFKKGPEQGIQVNILASVGPTLGLSVPYLIDYQTSPANPPFTQAVVAILQYDPVLTPEFAKTYRAEGFAAGLDRLSIVPGASIRAAVSFEFGTFRNSVTGFEAGVVADALSKKVIMMPAAGNNQFYTSAYVTIYYGGRR